MNDATEFESSLAGTIDFFQNLRRKLGQLETEAGAQHEQLRQITDALASFEQGRQADRQTFATLAEQLEAQTAQLAALQNEVRQVDGQLSQIETLAGGLQQDQQRARQTLVETVDELKAHGVGLRQALEADFAQRTVPTARVAALEERLSDHAQQIEGVLANAQSTDRQTVAVRDQLTGLESRLQQLDQNAQTITATLTDLSAALERHGQAQDALGHLVEANQALRPQLHAQQSQLDELAQSSSTVEHDLQELRQDVSLLTAEVETQRETLLEAGQNRQDLHKQQERLKYLETLITKLSADTSSTRQILNVLQSDLAIQSDTLREFDQTWREGLVAYQNRLEQLETAVVESTHPVTVAPQALLAKATPPAQESPFLESAEASNASPFLEPPQESPFLNASEESPFLSAPEESPFLNAPEESPFLDPAQDSPFLEAPQPAALFNTVAEVTSKLTPTESSIGQERFEALVASLASTSEEQQAIRDEIAVHFAATREEQDTFRTELSAAQNTLQTQHDYLSQLRDIIAEQLQAHQARLGELETALDGLRQTPAPADAAPGDLAPLREELNAQGSALAQLKESVEQQLALQRHHLDELEAALAHFSQVPSPAQESDLQPLRDALSDHASALALLRQETQQQLLDQTATVDRQRVEFQHAAEQLQSLQQDLEQLRACGGEAATAHEQRAPEAGGEDWHDFRQRLDTLNESIALLDNRLTGQAQAFTSNFAQFQGLNSDLQALQQHIANLEPSPRLGALEQGLAAQEQDIAQLSDDLQQIKRETERGLEAVQSGGTVSQIATLEEKLDRQQQQLTNLAATVETVRIDNRATQEKVLTMAANVAQRLHEFQNQLIAAKTAQGDQLQEVEQKLILLQVAFETMETQKKPRRWFSMPASFTTVVVTLGATLLAVAARAFWAFGAS
ncbi:MAG: hypothetical protein JNK31_09875 [Candidatus Competibacter sp.]|nr:hypothetical protein [Candidatus Competibacter sp.]